MKADKYLEVVITNLPKRLERDLTRFLFRNGCHGTAENLDFLQPSLRYEAKAIPKRVIQVSAYFSSADYEKIQGRIQVWIRDFSPYTVSALKIQKNKDWLSEWKKHFKRFKYCGFDFIPSWKKGSPGPRSILVEPGMAFGTGTHPTTQFAIRGLVDFKLNVKGRSILDVGTGSGILSVVAEKLGAKTISAVDNDPESWRVAKEMFKLNQCKRARIDKKQLAELVETHDVVLANIIDGVLLDISKLLIKRTKKGGLIILSGILTERSEGFVEKFSKKSSKKSNVELLKEYTDNEWTAFVLRKL